MDHPLASDLDLICSRMKDLWSDLREKRLFITGGTGFFGCWLLESFAWANERLELGAEMLVLTRDPLAFARKAPHLARRQDIRFHEGDVRTFAFPQGSFSHVIHAATDSSAALNAEHPDSMLDTIVKGTEHVLAFAKQAQTKTLLYVSSGAVYGPQLPEVTHMSEERELPAAETLESAYARGKSIAEGLCVQCGKSTDIAIKIARGFAFVGPHLPLDRHFAIGNFIRDGMRGGPIEVKGDGTPRRSYLYAADLALWLWTIFLRGTPLRPYNVGSERDLSIAEVAQAVADCFQPQPTIHIAQPIPNQKQWAERYVPSTRRARTELNLKDSTPLNEALRKTIDWYTQVQSSGTK